MKGMGFIAGVRRQWQQLGSRRMYFFGMIVVPIGIALFFLSLLGRGLPHHAPVGIVDLDNSELSRTMHRSIDGSELIEVEAEFTSTADALHKVRQGEIFGFFVIPHNFEKNTLAGKTPTLEFYSNMTFFIPGTLTFKGFKTVAVTTAAGVVQHTLTSMGLDSENAAALVQPVVFETRALGNPWMSYAIYLSPSFTMAVLVLMILFITAFSITMEIKNGTSREWLHMAGDNILLAVSSKLLPQTAIYTAVGIFIQWLFFGYSHFPMNGNLPTMLFATFLTIVAAQSLGLLFSSLVPNPRLAFTLCGLTGILAFSFTGFSFPVENMYGFIGIFSWFAPVRYWFLIYINEALNGYALYYSRYFFAALLVFPLVASTMLWNLRRACLNPIYVK